MTISSFCKIPRRRFLKDAGLVTASALSLASVAVGSTKQSEQPQSARSSRQTFFDLMRPPDVVTVYETTSPTILRNSNGSMWTANGISARTSPVAATVDRPAQMMLEILGTAEPVDNAGVSLWLDVRSGASPVLLGGRTVDLCNIITREGHEDETPWQAARTFCTLLCRNPRLPAAPVYGGNNWYCAYGENCSAKTIERDAGVLADLSGGHTNRPFQVIDDGWQLAGANTDCCSGGPWRYGNEAFLDMPGFQHGVRSLGIVYQDDQKANRWVLTFDDPVVLAEIDSVFVTIEPPGGSNKPTGNMLLSAFLKTNLNHP